MTVVYTQVCNIYQPDNLLLVNYSEMLRACVWWHVHLQRNYVLITCNYARACLHTNAYKSSCSLGAGTWPKRTVAISSHRRNSVWQREQNFNYIYIGCLFIFMYLYFFKEWSIYLYFITHYSYDKALLSYYQKYKEILEKKITALYTYNGRTMGKSWTGHRTVRRWYVELCRNFAWKLLFLLAIKAWAQQKSETVTIHMCI